MIPSLSDQISFDIGRQVYGHGHKGLQFPSNPRISRYYCHVETAQLVPDRRWRGSRPFAQFDGGAAEAQVLRYRGGHGIANQSLAARAVGLVRKNGFLVDCRHRPAGEGDRQQ